MCRCSSVCHSAKWSHKHTNVRLRAKDARKSTPCHWILKAFEKRKRWVSLKDCLCVSILDYYETRANVQILSEVFELVASVQVIVLVLLKNVKFFVVTKSKELILQFSTKYLESNLSVGSIYCNTSNSRNLNSNENKDATQKQCVTIIM